MGEISQSIRVNGFRVKALFDSGATENHLSQRVADKVRLYFRGEKVAKFRFGDGQPKRRSVGRLR